MWPRCIAQQKIVSNLDSGLRLLQRNGRRRALASRVGAAIMSKDQGNTAVLQARTYLGYYFGSFIGRYA